MHALHSLHALHVLHALHALHALKRLSVLLGFDTEHRHKVSFYCNIENGIAHIKGTFLFKVGMGIAIGLEPATSSNRVYYNPKSKTLLLQEHLALMLAGPAVDGET